MRSQHGPARLAARIVSMVGQNDTARRQSTGRMPLRLMLVAAIYFSGLGLYAQPTAGSIATRSLPALGTSIVDSTGNVYVMGTSGTVTPGAAQTQPGSAGTTDCIVGGGLGPPLEVPCPNVYLARIDAAGNLVFGTWLGGPNKDSGTAFAVDSAGNVYVTGTTGGSFPTTPNAALGSFQTLLRNASATSAFAAKLSADGSEFLYATYLPATMLTASAIAVDAAGNAYVTGNTSAGHAYVTKLSADGSAFLYTAMLVGSNQDAGSAIVVDAAGNAVVAGETKSPDFPVTTGVVQAQLAGVQNIFVTKLDSSGNTLFSTYLGGTGSDAPNVAQFDSAGNIYVAGSTTSLDFPTTAGSFEPTARVPMWNLSPGGFIAKLAPDLSALGYSSYVMSLDYGLESGVTSLALGDAGDAYIAGITGAGFPVTQSAPQQCFGNAVADVFVAHLNSHGALLDATYALSYNSSVPPGLALATDGSVLVASAPSGAGPSTLALSRIQFGGPGWIPPACMSGDILNSALLYGSGSVAPGELITLTGFGIGPVNGISYQPDALGRAPLGLSGVEVLFDGQPAPVIYAQSQVVNALAPFELSGKTSTTIALRYNDATFGPVTVPVAFANPGIFRLQPGFSAQAVARNQDGTINGPTNPASPGSIVTALGTGYGPFYPPCTTGGLNAPVPVNLAPGFSITVNSGNASFSNPSVLYAGGAPGLLCGVMQFNIEIPNPFPSGPFQFAPEALMASPFLPVLSSTSAIIYVK
jgi:uncharacterized protein (TIGR03437 family)